MRAAKATWIIAAKVAIGYISGASAAFDGTFEELEKLKMLDPAVIKKDEGIAQKVMVTVLTSASIPGTEQEPVGEDSRESSHQGRSVVTVTSKSAVLI